MSSDESYSLGQVEVTGSTAKGLWVKVESTDADEFIPFSQIHDDSEIYESAKKGDSGELIVTEWLAEQRGWI